MAWPRGLWPLIKSSVKSISEDKAPMMGAALAYYTVFSIAPLLVIAIGVTGLVFGRGGDEHIFATLQGLLGENGARAIESMVRSASSRPRAGLVATFAGLATLLVGASSVFAQLQESLNVIWKVTPKPNSGWGHWLKQRLLSFSMVAVIAFILLVSLLVSAALSATGKYLSDSLPGGAALWGAVNFTVSFGIVSALFAAIFKVLPDVRLTWKDVGPGAVFTALLFTIGKSLIGLYIGKSGTASSYGAAGSLIVVLVWVFYSSEILLFGAEFTRAHATRGGRVVRPKEGARFTAAGG